MTVKTKWILRNKRNNIREENRTKLEEDLISSFGLSALAADLLINRGCSSIEEGRRYLEPSLNDLHDPFLFEDMKKVVKRIIDARENNEKICIYGDYDADGTIGTAILLKFMKEQEFDVTYFIPNRLVTGYGLHISPLQDIIAAGVTLLITVDNGISANEQVDFCNEKKCDVIITDHHECHGSLPKAYGIINPKVPNAAYPFKELCGAGVAFKLVQALGEILDVVIDLQESIECVALATVSDLVPLQDENRCLVSLGLNYLNNGPKNPGLQALMEVSELKTLKAWHFGFVLGPKINAAGRLGEADHVVELLIGTDTKKIMSTACFLRDENKKRQELESKIFEEALQTVDSLELYKDEIIVVVGENWHAGVIGIVASRIQEKYYNPVITISVEDGVGKASCRSVDGFNIFEALLSCEELFISFGGHEQAAGFSIKKENIEMMKAKVIDYGKSVDIKKQLIKKVYYDAQINEADITWATLDELALFEPCGLGNPGIQFLMNNVTTISMGTMGRENNHLRLSLKNGLKAVGFGLGDFYSTQVDVLGGDYNGVMLVCRLDMNEYRGNTTLQLQIKDIKLNPVWQVNQAMQLVKTIVMEENPKQKIEILMNENLLEELKLSVVMIRKIYVLLKKSEEYGVPIQKVGEGSQNVSPFHVLMSCEILREAGLIAYGIKNEIVFSKIIPANEKKDIQNTKLMIKLEKIISDE
ncbi:single-stranded-DNA-specific exonuclease RecJ [Acetobacterium paludosum]|uniref:Single-stranded-DNA-specific exonuclease RecJ n=1 Tax=Acetobacterium paludosum TaxID=52693 RepID=A0A923HS12_9FIRM|nr:single-stranded-DNA-specific exonuclease RecJ [Acetobacterium paludosum]MBC3887654.1 single-stranded-DNA-specific exonuclease RecJ [Acetobacterium paludosum]